MGTDIDFALQLRKNKLVSNQFQQPVTELDAVTEPNEQPSAEFLLNIMRLLELRLGNRMDDNHEGPVAVVIQLSNNQQMIITFANQRRPRVRQPPRESPLQRIMREIMQDGNDRLELQLQPRGQMMRQPLTQIQQPERQPMQESPQIIPQVKYQERDWDSSRNNQQDQENAQIYQNPRQQQSLTILSRSFPQQSELRHQQSVGSNIKPQQQLQKIQPQLKKKDSTNNLSDEQQFSPNPESKQEFQGQMQREIRPERNLVDFNHENRNGLDQTFVPFSHHNSLHSINAIHNSQRRQQVQDDVTCWQAFVRMISNIFRPRS